MKSETFYNVAALKRAGKILWVHKKNSSVVHLLGACWTVWMHGCKDGWGSSEKNWGEGGLGRGEEGWGGCLDRQTVYILLL